MRTLLVLPLLAAAACASTSGGSAGPTTPRERQGTTVTYTTADGRQVNINLESSRTLETRSTPIAATPQQVWAALPLAYQDLGIALAAYDSVQLYIGNPGLEIRNGRLGAQRVSRFLNCGADPLGGPITDRYSVRLNVVSRVRAAPDGALLETQVTGDASQRGVAASAVPCSSTGSLEDALANAVKLRLAGGFPSPRS
jgi:hypothetical protein